MPRTFRIPSRPPTGPSNPSLDQVNLGPGGGTRASPELVESDKAADVEELSDGGAGSAKHAGDREASQK